MDPESTGYKKKFFKLLFNKILELINRKSNTIYKTNTINPPMLHKINETDTYIIIIKILINFFKYYVKKIP